MNLDQYQYSIAGIKAVEIYPFSKKAKRYFKGYNIQAPNHLYRIVVYDYQLVKEEPLIQALNSLRGIEHENLGKILNIYQQITMSKAGLKPSEQKIKQFRQKVIAVILEDNQQGQYINIFDFVVQMGTLSQALAQFFAFKLLNLIKSMQQKGFKNCFNSNNVLIERNTGLIKIDNYGDSNHFVISEQNVSDTWELGEFLFTLLKKCPPFAKKSQSDPRFNLLTKGDFQKFWSTFPNKPIKNPSTCVLQFLNQCFKKQTTLESLEACQWFHGYVPLSEQERVNQLSTLAQQKQDRMQKLSSKQTDRRQKILKSARQSTNLAHQRGTQPQFIQNFLDNYFRQQQHNRFHTQIDNQQERQSQRIRIADLLTNLKTGSNNEVRIYNVVQNGNTINFKIKVDLEEILMEETEVELEIQKHNKKIVFVTRKIDAPFYQSLWINNYLTEHLLDN